MAKMVHWQDKSGKLKKVFDKVMKKYFPELLKAEFLFAFRNNDKFDDEEQVIIAEARKIGSKERDLYGFDFDITVHHDTWTDSKEEMKYRIAFHELSHCGLKLDDEGVPKRDANDHLITEMIKHDIYIKSFKTEIEIFGLDGEDLVDSAKFLSEALSNQDKAKKRRQKFIEGLGITTEEPEPKPKKKVTVNKGNEEYTVNRAPKKKKKKQQVKSEF
jgi:hypothetical protein